MVSKQATKKFLKNAINKLIGGAAGTANTGTSGVQAAATLVATTDAGQKALSDIVATTVTGQKVVKDLATLISLSTQECNATDSYIKTIAGCVLTVAQNLSIKAKNCANNGANGTDKASYNVVASATGDKGDFFLGIQGVKNNADDIKKLLYKYNEIKLYKDELCQEFNTYNTLLITNIINKTNYAKKAQTPTGDKKTLFNNTADAFVAVIGSLNRALLYRSQAYAYLGAMNALSDINAAQKYINIVDSCFNAKVAVSAANQSVREAAVTTVIAQTMRKSSSGGAKSKCKCLKEKDDDKQEEIEEEDVEEFINMLADVIKQLDEEEEKEEEEEEKDNEELIIMLTEIIEILEYKEVVMVSKTGGKGKTGCKGKTGGK